MIQRNIVRNPMLICLPITGNFHVVSGRARDFCISGWNARTDRNVTEIESQKYQIMTCNLA